ncbi:Peptidase M20D, amidohydrolase [Rubrobacter xylanophilus DSM 9941]|uniref:Peptidase M20D, amidohydrolase n=1 Tax=Rubrobacter xylanophilus (strain DSM 9941 / JCM 11954 / NBRC 16129 / PRD-1) TaxID=266117 RepID=Q1AZM0_RUBXD|nr:M20 family metallopeptidase [Rubrobacter xylanophilus]ABG03158.1 Peptidase M20D, amidohydrolase [Rubrobacter xylanophilus DSM 9941]
MSTTRKAFGGLLAEAEREHAKRIVALRREIHREPELGFDTARTAAKVVASLEGLPLEVREGVAENGVVADLRGATDGPVVGLRADMDALPIREETGLPFASEVEGRMHACGHDGHTSMLVGAAHLLSGMRERVEGTVRFLFQPAEEGGGGGRVMVEEGALEGVEAVFALHLWPGLPFGVASTAGGPTMAAADAFELTVRGRGGHGAMPHLTADAVVAASHIVAALQTLVSRETDPTEPAVLTVGQLEAGSAFNIIPETARLTGTVRTVDEKLRRVMPRRIEELAKGVARAMRADASLEYAFSYPVTRNDPREAGFALEVAAGLFGEEGAVEASRPSMAAEDFAFMLEAVPGAYIWLGVGDVPGLHTPRFSFDERVLPRGAALLAALALARLGS